jgi:hypothetical protein
VTSRGQVRTAWHAKRVFRQIYRPHGPPLAVEFVTRFGDYLHDASQPSEVPSLRISWRDRIAAGQRVHVTNGPTEAGNKPMMRIALGLYRFHNNRIRALLYAGSPDGDLLATITPC